MAFLKSVLKKQAVQRTLSALAANYIRLINLTGRWRLVGADEIKPGNTRPLIIAFWHGRMLMMPPNWPKAMPVKMLISQHGDGVLIADAIRHFDIGCIQGSTKRGGTAALRGVLAALKDGVCVGITPDGPRGPRMRCTGAIADIAKLSGTPILPATYAARWRIVFGSWDRFVLPLPFTRGVVLAGTPIEIARDADSEAARLMIETQLNELTARADAMMGVDTIMPANMEPAGAAGS